ncbi:MAG TPA: sulfite exporter TauE/SafE family protein [Pyrinomonadaceae bacterium]|nr:sulfite exporter TauE/SafE family protein [Pyrinomonadaceae bacterium]
MNIILLFSTASTFAILGLGFLLGLKHATEADHLAAVGTMVSERKSLWSSIVVGGLWGLGHTISLFVAGIFVLFLNFQISEKTERILEFCVGIMLLVLGLNVLRKFLKGGELHFHAHAHNAHEHTHPHTHTHKDEPHTHHGFSFNPRALIIGMIHGLAGSAALMLLLIPTIESKTVGLIYIIIFGIGSIGGMMIMSFLVGLPFHFTAFRAGNLNRILQGIAALVSIVIGLTIIYEKGVTENLFG